MLKKSLIALGVAGLLASGLALAGHDHGRDGPRFSPEERMDMMKRRLDLTDEQAKKVDAIFQDAMAKHRAIHDATHEQLKAVLTPAQLEELESMGPRGRHGRDAGEGTPQR